MRSDPELMTRAWPQDYHLHYALQHAPFSIESDTSLFVLSASHEEALDKLHRGLRARKSFLLITGAPGTGKTLLLQTLQELATERCEFLHLHSQDLLQETRLSSLLLRAANAPAAANGATDISTRISTSIATPVWTNDRGATEHNAELRNYLQKARNDGRRIVVVIDDAQGLTDTQLHELRQWSNMDDHNGTLLQFLLAGHTCLTERLNQPEMANLKQRIGTRFRLPALNLVETQRYIAHRCLLAGAAQTLFDHSVVIRIYSLTRGLPRLINTVADALLLQAYLRGSRTVELEDVRLVSRDLDLTYAPIIDRPEKAPPRGFSSDRVDSAL